MIYHKQQTCRLVIDNGTFRHLQWEEITFQTVSKYPAQNKNQSNLRICSGFCAKRKIKETVSQEKLSFLTSLCQVINMAHRDRND